jgi:hypothetical protein
MYQYTVLSYEDDTGEIHCDVVETKTPQLAMFEVAKKRNDCFVVSVIKGALLEDEHITFPGDSVVSSETILSQPEVFADY